jgi:hypothetical protein
MFTPQEIATAALLGSPVPEDVAAAYHETQHEVLQIFNSRLKGAKTQEPYVSDQYHWITDGITAFGMLGNLCKEPNHGSLGHTTKTMLDRMAGDHTTINGLRSPEDIESLYVEPELLLLALEFAEMFGATEETLCCQVGSRITTINCWPGIVAVAQKR